MDMFTEQRDDFFFFYPHRSLVNPWSIRWKLGKKDQKLNRVETFGENMATSGRKAKEQRSSFTKYVLGGIYSRYIVAILQQPCRGGLLGPPPRFTEEKGGIQEGELILLKSHSS